MHKRTIFAATLAALFSLTACTEKSSQPQQVEVNPENIKAHITFLADDTLKGRDTGSEGYQIAANYVKSHFKQMGLKPRGEFDSYEQQVTFRKAFLEPESAKMIVENAGQTTEITMPDQFFISGSALHTDSMVTAETVFVGYGVVSEEFGYNDYQDLDVEGKIVVALTGRPADLPSEEGAHIGSGSEKVRHAAERGAVGYITLHTPKRDKVRAYATSAKYANGPRYSWLDNNGKPYGKFDEIKGGGYLHFDHADALFEGASMTAEQVFSADSADEKISGFALNAKVTLAAKTRHEEITSPNLIGVLEGSDPTLKDEFVVFSAHLDHIGMSSHGDHEDNINNGALDNASGVSILLETARMLSMQAEKPKRSVLFVVVTGEEKGLLGSSYFAQNPTVPVMNMVANVNLDMPLILYPFADVIAFGSTHSTLGPIVERAAAKIDISLSEDPMPEQALFTRSDHYSFVKAGIPSVFLMTGFQSKDPNVNGGEIFKDFLKNHYHQHSDQTDLPIRYDVAAEFAKVNMMIGLEIANQQDRPKWNDGDFFGKTFAQ
ncbi:M28 family peptidase [Thalassotalea sp. LPB0316]|uniref:M28 family metallopeptidase n=1 Tax=Thalassotalea sp. LPB0316 TaxID=2769490 RepID=UPI0018687D74|nr:M28 family metallopeptidase [Thalassotalea sp. LPB0316]QOL26616.1 M28 family peptidase [Thalassotalea sp. LPB0316]